MICLHFVSELMIWITSDLLTSIEGGSFHVKLHAHKISQIKTKGAKFKQKRLHD